MLLLIHPIAKLLLIWRAAFSRDPRSKKIGAIVVLGMVILLPAILSGLVRPEQIFGRARYYAIFTSGLTMLPGLYLLFWAFRSKDGMVLRVASGVAGLAVLAPFVGLGWLLALMAGR